MNIYCIEITSVSFEDRVWTEGENPFEAVARAYQDIREDVEGEISEVDDLTVKVSLTQGGMSMGEFEEAHPDFFFT